MKIYIVVPAYNEEDRIGKVISDLINHNYKNIVVVDDCSQDQTYLVAQTQGVVALRHLLNRGQGATLQTGNDYALNHGADIIVHFDADGQMRAEEISKLLQPLMNNEADIVLGSRYLQKGNQLPWLKKYVYFPIGKLVNLIFTGLWLNDAHCGFRALNRVAAETIRIRQDRMAHASEILEKINLNKLRFKEVGVVIDYENFGQGLLGINGAFKTVKDLLKAKLFK